MVTDLVAATVVGEGSVLGLEHEVATMTAQVRIEATRSMPTV